jgi:hypothetical protein
MKTKTQLMKNIFTLSMLLVLSLSSFANTYYTYTANKSGIWNTEGTWTKAVRNDNVEKDKFIIPASIVITANEDVNTLGSNDVEIQISGILRLAASTTLFFGENSKIEILSSGSIEGNRASQQIFIGDVSKYTGNVDKTLNGPLYADAYTTGFVAYSMLSVNFISFSGSIDNDNILSLKWSVSNEVNNKHYEIEARNNNNDWKKVGVVIANNNNSVTKAYQFINKSATAGTTSYRLKQVDTDGSFQYSNTISITNNQMLPSAKVFAANKTVNVEFASEVKATVAVKIMNMNGAVVSSQSYNHPSKISLSVNHLNSGAYVVYVTDNRNITSTQKVMIN